MSSDYDPIRDARILNTVIADCFGQDEELTGWYYYMRDFIAYPFPALVRLTQPDGRIEEKTVSLLGIDPQSESRGVLRAGVREHPQDRVQYILFHHIVEAYTSRDNLEIINDWLYWHNYPLLYPVPSSRLSGKRG